MQDTIQIHVPNTRNWTTLAAVKAVFTDEQIVEMVHRYCNDQDYRKAYRTRRNERNKVLLALGKEVMQSQMKGEGA